MRIDCGQFNLYKRREGVLKDKSLLFTMLLAVLCVFGSPADAGAANPGFEPLVEALKLVGPKLSTEACIEKLNTFKNWKGLGGAITWTKDRHQGTDSVQIHKCGPGGKSIMLQDWTSNELATWEK